MAVVDYGIEGGKTKKNTNTERRLSAATGNTTGSPYVSQNPHQKSITQSVQNTAYKIANSTTLPQKTTTTTTTNNSAPTYVSNGGGGSSSGGSSSSTKQAVRTDMDATPVYDANAVYQRYLDSLRQQANDAYALNMERIRQAYDSNSRTLQDSLNSTRSQLQSAYDKSARDVRDDSEQALRDSYVNYMLSRKNLGQELSALGLNGGEAESTVGSLINNYGNSRNNIETTRNRNLRDLGDTLQSSLNSALSQYNSALQNLQNYRLNAENSAENARQNLLANYAVNLSDLATSNSSYLNMLRSLADSMGTVNLGDVEASNAYEGANVRQGLPTPGDVGNAYAKYIAQAQMMRQSGATDDDIKDYLFGSVGNDNNALTQIFAQLGLV